MLYIKQHIYICLWISRVPRLNGGPKFHVRFKIQTKVQPKIEQGQNPSFTLGRVKPIQVLAQVEPFFVNGNMIRTSNLLITIRSANYATGSCQN